MHFLLPHFLLLCINIKSTQFMPQDLFLIGKPAIDRDDKPTRIS